MTASLEDRVAAYIADHPGSTAADVVVHIRRRAADVRRVLNSSSFGFAEDTQGRKHYFLAAMLRDGLGRPLAPDQKLNAEDVQKAHREFVAELLGVGDADDWPDV